MLNIRSRNHTNRLLTLFSVALLCFQLQISHAEEFADEVEEDRFQVEYIIFKHSKSDTSELRFSDTRYRLPSVRQYNYLTSGFEPLTPFHHPKLDAEDATLSRALKQLQRSRDVEVVDHGVWQQEIPPNTTLDPFLISKTLSNEGTSSNLYEEAQLNGTLTIKRARYLHAEVDLYLADFIFLPSNNTVSWLLSDTNNNLKTQWFLQALTLQEHYLHKDSSSKIALNLVHMNQSRRLKYSEVHYLDHPALGVVVTISKIEPTLE